MRILLLGSLISTESMEEINKNSSEKASIAPVNYETMLVKGLVENGAVVDAISVPAVAAYPNSIYKRIEKKKEIIVGVTATWVPFINVQGLKQTTIKKSVYKFLKDWLEKHKEEKDKVVMMYSIYPPYTYPAIELCHKYGCHLNAIITDLPEYMYTWKGTGGIRQRYAQHMKKQMMELQTACGSYILFTKKMAKRMGIEDKPYIVSEGLGDSTIYDGIEELSEYEKPTVIYAGNLSKLYGIKSLVGAFMQVQGDYELHLYGAGGDSKYIEECAATDRRIKYFGRVARQEVLTALKRAHLIVINKPTADDYSNYSFSSKILECMLSGTPVLTTKVGGMPEEYYEYLYFIEDESPSGIAEAICNTLADVNKGSRGQAARRFAVEQKNCNVMTKRILNFVEKLSRDKING